MKTGLAQDATKSAKNLAQSVAKQMVHEPFEILRDVKEQTTGQESRVNTNPQNSGSHDEQKKLVEQQNDLQDKLKSSRRMEALNRELTDIQKRDLFSDLQRRISAGEEIPLEDYPNLSVEEKQVLRAQMEAVKVQKSNLSTQTSGFSEPAVKKGRQLFNFGKKTAMVREQTHVEKPVPPSG